MTNILLKDISTGQINITTGTCRWDISNYSLYDNYSTGRYIQSPVFNVVNARWHIRLYPNGDRENCKDYLACYLYCEADHFDALYLFVILDSDDEIFKCYNSDSMSTFKKSTGWGVRQFVKKSKVKEKLDTVLNDDKLVIACYIRRYNTIIYDTSISNNVRRLEHFHKFENLVNNEKFSDVKFVVEGKEIHAHKNIITANSEVFAAMFEHNMKESQNNTVEIEDVSYTVMYKLLQFMYCGKTDDIDEIASELFVAADKYKLLELKDLCEKELCENLSINNAIEYFNLADLHEADKLKTEAMNFIVAHGKDMVDLTEFSTIAKLNESLILQIFRAVFSKEKDKAVGVSENDK